MENNRKDAGRKLKEAREKRSLTLDQVQKQTKIHSSVLAGLEDGRVSDTLTDTYVRSFLKQYAQFLGINSVEILKDYFPARNEGPAINNTIPDSPLSKESDSSPKVLYITALIVGAVILLALFALIVGKISSVLKRPRAVVHKTSTMPQTKAKTRSTKAVQKKKSAAKTASGKKDFIPKSAQLILEIKIKEPVLVKLKKDGVLLFERVLPKGMVEKVTASSYIEIDFGKAQSLELVLNGRPIILSGKNAIFGLEITRKGIKLR